MVLAMRHQRVEPKAPARGSEASAGAQEMQWDEDSLGDNTLQAVLQNCYNVFRLLHGEIQSFVKEHRHKLFDLLEDFIPAFLETIDHSDLGIFHELDGFHYGALIARPRRATTNYLWHE